MTHNYLAQESSLYLLQHAYNPVAWYPWGKTALDKAKQENKPILLSIGYSACHWCHVMANESFSDLETANLMNELFINIKVDREERPDLDKIYQLAHQILTNRGGGWPLTVFLDPDDLTPFFAGTYFPLTPRYGMPAFKDLLVKIAEYFQTHRHDINEQSWRMRKALQQLTEIKPTEIIQSNELLHKAWLELKEQFDPINGGFGSAPKFPHPTNIEFLLRYCITHKKETTVFNTINTTLIKMANGGIYDQLGGGFYRYSVDAEWNIPHFEKMLYDNAQLLTCYAQAFALTQDPLFARIATETAEWVVREMRSPEGGFYATLDADSEHIEGKFYYWDKDEIQKLLTKKEFTAIESYFGLDKSPNFEKHWHLYIAQPTKPSKAIDSARQKLLTARDQRVHPGRDEKIITAWNGLMIKGLATAGQHLNSPDLIKHAQQTVDFIRNKLWVNHRLYSIYQNGSAKIPAFLDDYAFLLDGILALLAVKWRSEDCQFAIELADALLKHFADQENGGFFFTPDDHETLIQRPKPLMDEAIPAGNGVAAFALAHLGYLTGENRYLTAAEKTLETAMPALTAYPAVHGSLLNALEDYLTPPQMIILRGDETKLTEWQAACEKHYIPQRLIFAIPENASHLPAELAQKKAEAGKVVAYICQGTQCLEPIRKAETLVELLKQNPRSLQL